MCIAHVKAEQVLGTHDDLSDYAYTAIHIHAPCTQKEFSERWAPLDDVVMGGLSASQIIMTPEGNAKMQGVRLPMQCALSYMVLLCKCCLRAPQK
jgi:hypothetical protein